tara:strand:- start:2382 stop:2642 length:261 start_codon:yes stop_codon:yes gene_type:complete
MTILGASTTAARNARRSLTMGRRVLPRVSGLDLPVACFGGCHGHDETDGTEAHWFFYYDFADRLCDIKHVPDIPDSSTFSLYLHAG